MVRAETTARPPGFAAGSSVKVSPHELRGLVLALIALLVVFGLKLTAYFVTGYMSLFAEALHTLSDIVITALLLAAAIWSRRRADATYAFGYGRAQNIAALVAAVLLISFTSYKLFEEAVPVLFGPEPSDFRNINLALAIIGASLAISLIPFLVLLRQESKGASAKAQLVELTSDVLGLVAAFAGTLIATKVNGYADPVASLVVAVIIALNAFGLARANVSLLLGRSPGDEFKAKVLQAGQAVPGVLRVVDVAAEYVGQDVIHAGVRIQVERGTPIEKAEAIAGEVKERIHREIGGEYCLVQVESAGQSQRRKPEMPRPTEL